MDEVWNIAYSSIPINVILPSLALLCIAVVVIVTTCRSQDDMRRWLLVALLAEYVLIVVWSTVIRRPIGTEAWLELMPYWNIEDGISGRKPHVFPEYFLNVVLFVPIGLLLSGIFRDNRLSRIALTGCCMSVTIELLQLYRRCGICETDDILHNTLGTILGWIIWRGCVRLKGRRTRNTV